MHSGAVEATIHHEELIIATGGTFIVPRGTLPHASLSACLAYHSPSGNQYEIRNIAQRETVLFFAQARKVPIEEDEGTQTAGSVPPSIGHRRSMSSVPRHSTGPPRSPAPNALQQLKQQSFGSKPSPAAHRAGSTASPSKSRLSSASPAKPSHHARGHSSIGRPGGR